MGSSVRLKKGGISAGGWIAGMQNKGSCWSAVFQPRVPSWNLSEKYRGIFLLFSVFEESVFFSAQLTFLFFI